jgi:hypothetical protein
MVVLDVSCFFISTFFLIDHFYQKVATEAVNFDKMGEATCKSVLGLVAWGECSIDEAMKNGQLTKIHHVDQLTMSIAFIYSEYTVKAYGE